MPPPPVAGAAVTTGLPEWPGAADGGPLAAGVLALAAPLVPLAGVVAAVPVGDNEVGVPEGRFCDGNDPEQAETDKDATMVNVAQPALSLACSSLE